MLELETRGAVVLRNLKNMNPELWKEYTQQPAFKWEMFPLKDALVDWDDLSFHKILTCVNHPRSRFITKNPWSRSVFMIRGVAGGPEMIDEECDCPFDDMRYIIDGMRYI